jgi:hypothetical protein
MAKLARICPGCFRKIRSNNHDEDGGDQPSREFLRARSPKVADAIAHLRHSWPKKFHATSQGVTVASCQFAANTHHWAHVLYGFCDPPYSVNALISDALPCLVLAPVSGPAVRRCSRKEGQNSLGSRNQRNSSWKDPLTSDAAVLIIDELFFGCECLGGPGKEKTQRLIQCVREDMEGHYQEAIRNSLPSSP